MSLFRRIAKVEKLISDNAAAVHTIRGVCIRFGLLGHAVSTQQGRISAKPGHGFGTNVCVAEAAEFMHSTYLRCSDHGGSAMRVYASPGIFNFGTAFHGLDIAHVFPSQFFTFGMMQMLMIGSLPGIKQFVVLVLFSVLLSQGSISNAIIGGWSLGTLLAFHAASELEACSLGPRMVFAFDPRLLLPRPPCFTRVKPSTQRWSREVVGSPKRVDYSQTSTKEFAEVPKGRFLIPCLDFTCRLAPNERESFFMSDDTIAARLPLYTIGGHVYAFPDAFHETIGVDHMWDIARRLRGSVLGEHDTSADLKQIFS